MGDEIDGYLDITGHRKRWNCEEIERAETQL